MEKSSYVLIGIIILFVISLIVAVVVFNYKGTSLSPVSALEECKSLSYSSPNALNLLFFSDKETAEKYSNYLLTISPYKENSKAFNFYYIDSYTPSCELYQSIALLCYSKSLIAKAASCPHDYIIAFQSKSGEIRSSSYMSVLSLNTAHPLSVFPHELGHALGFLAEEYVPAAIPSKAENCVSSCALFNNQSDGCFEGCSKSEFKRSIDLGFMRSLNADSYGKFDEEILSNRLPKIETSKTTGSVISNPNDCQNNKFYLVKAVYNSTEDKIKILNKELVQGCPGTNGFGDFNYSIILEDNSIALQDSFNPVLIFTDSQSESQETISGDVFESQKPFYLSIPQIEKAKSLQIQNNDHVIGEIKLNDLGSRPCRI